MISTTYVLAQELLLKFRKQKFSPTSGDTVTKAELIKALDPYIDSMQVVVSHQVGENVIPIKGIDICLDVEDGFVLVLVIP